MQVSVSDARPRLSLKRARSLQPRPPFAARRRQLPPWQLVAAAVVPLALVAVVAYLARRRLFQGAGLVAEAVEEVADTVEEAAEDLAEAAKKRAERPEAAE
jgi:hypothetical protein